MDFHLIGLGMVWVSDSDLASIIELVLGDYIVLSLSVARRGVTSQN